MSQNMTVNGTVYAFPVNLEANWGTVVTNWAAAVSSSTLQKSGGTYTLTAEVDFGATYGLKSAYFKSRGTNAAAAGVLRLANAESLSWRNAANGADLALKVNSSDQLTFNDIVLSASTALTASRAMVSDASGYASVSSVTATELGYVSGVTSAIQTQLGLKAAIAGPTFTGTVTTPALNVSGLTATTVPYLDSSKNLTSSAVTPTELGYVSGVTSGIQTQFSAKAALASPTFTGTVTTPNVIVSGLTATTVPYLNASKQLTSSAVTPTELGYVSGVTSGIQSQINSISTGSVPAGALMPYAGTSAPTGYLLCDGSNISRSTYSVLFTAISTTYGVGDGSTTFALPDLRGRAVFGKDNMGGTDAGRIQTAGGFTGTTLGSTGGAATVTLSTSEMPTHHHTLFTRDTGAASGATDRVMLANSGGNAVNKTTNLTIDDAGSSGAHNNMPTGIILNYIIKT